MLSLDIINNTIKERNMAKIASPSIPKHFSQIKDPRRDNKRHNLVDIIETRDMKKNKHDYKKHTDYKLSEKYLVRYLNFRHLLSLKPFFFV